MALPNFAALVYKYKLIRKKKCCETKSKQQRLGSFTKKDYFQFMVKVLFM